MRLVGHLVEEAVAAQQVAVARERRHLPRVDADLAVDAERAGEDVALRVHLRLLVRERALAHHALDEAVILGHLDERAVLQHIHARVADVHDREPLVVLDHHERDRAQRGAHAAHRVVGVRHLEHTGVRDLDGSNERLERAIGDRGAQRVEREPRRDLARRVTAHAVATANSGKSTSQLSSFALRTRPASVAAPQRKRVVNSEPFVCSVIRLPGSCGRPGGCPLGGGVRQP